MSRNVTECRGMSRLGTKVHLRIYHVLQSKSEIEPEINRRGMSQIFLFLDEGAFLYSIQTQSKWEISDFNTSRNVTIIVGIVRI